MFQKFSHIYGKMPPNFQNFLYSSKIEILCNKNTQMYLKLKFLGKNLNIALYRPFDIRQKREYQENFTPKQMRARMYFFCKK